MPANEIYLINGNKGLAKDTQAPCFIIKQNNQISPFINFNKISIFANNSSKHIISTPFNSFLKISKFLFCSGCSGLPRRY